MLCSFVEDGVVFYECGFLALSEGGRGKEACEEEELGKGIHDG